MSTLLYILIKFLLIDFARSSDKLLSSWKTFTQEKQKDKSFETSREHNE